MDTIIKALKSRTFWTVVIMFLIAGFQGVQSLIPAGFVTPVLGLLSLVAVYFKLNPSQVY